MSETESPPGEFLILIQPDAPKSYTTVTITAEELAASSVDRAGFLRAVLDLTTLTADPETKPMGG